MTCVPLLDTPPPHQRSYHLLSAPPEDQAFDTYMGLRRIFKLYIKDDKCVSKPALGERQCLPQVAQMPGRPFLLIQRAGKVMSLGLNDGFPGDPPGRQPTERL